LSYAQPGLVIDNNLHFHCSPYKGSIKPSLQYFPNCRVRRLSKFLSSSIRKINNTKYLKTHMSYMKPVTSCCVILTYICKQYEIFVKVRLNLIFLSLRNWQRTKHDVRIIIHFLESLYPGLSREIQCDLDCIEYLLVVLRDRSICY
jgi:hypothetical protein